MDSINNDSSFQLARSGGRRTPPPPPRQPAPSSRPPGGTGDRIDELIRRISPSDPAPPSDPANPPARQPANPAPAQNNTDRSSLSDESTSEVAQAPQSVPDFASAFQAA